MAARKSRTAAVYWAGAGVAGAGAAAPRLLAPEPAAGRRGVAGAAAGIA